MMQVGYRAGARAGCAICANFSRRRSGSVHFHGVTLIDRYQIIRLLGEGAMGKVYLATDPKLQRTVALKVLASEIENAEMRERFRLEVRAVAALRHPNIVELYDYSGEQATQMYFVMEYVPGPSLFELSRTYGVMPEVTALCIGHELALALDHAHGQQIVHRDLKPENILLHKGRLVLTDFGIVKAVGEANALGVRFTSPRTRVLGTPGFMAPEQFAGQNIDHRTDLFALGAVLYNLTTGHVPYEGGTVEHIYRNLKAGKCDDPRSQNKALTPGFCNIIAACIAPKPNDRFASAAQLKDAIRSLLNDHGATDIRDELRAYEASPRDHRQQPVAHDPRLESLLGELKGHLAGKDSTAARQVMQRLNLPGHAANSPATQKCVWGKRAKGFNWGFVMGMVSGAAVMWAVNFARMLGTPTCP